MCHADGVILRLYAVYLFNVGLVVSCWRPFRSWNVVKIFCRRRTMLRNSVLELVAVRAVILVIRYQPLLDVILLAPAVALLAVPSLSSYLPTIPRSLADPFLRLPLVSYLATLPLQALLLLLWTVPLAVLLAAEGLFYLLVFRPHMARHENWQRPRQPGRHQHHRYADPSTTAAVLTPDQQREQRAALFARCASTVPDGERYVRGWFLGARIEDIGREDMRDFLLWAFFERDHGADLTGDERDELEGYVAATERMLGRQFAPGRGTAKSLRLTVDPVKTAYRSVVWYGIIALLDVLAHLGMRRADFEYHWSPKRRPAVFPPRPQLWRLGRHRQRRIRGCEEQGVSRSSWQDVKRGRQPDVWDIHQYLPEEVKEDAMVDGASDEFGYWHRPHTAKDRVPVVFLHGVGIGMAAYVAFLDELNSGHDGSTDKSSHSSSGQIGILAPEILPISSRLSHRGPPSKDEFLSQLTRALHNVGWGSADQPFVLVAHSYGSVLATHVLRDPELGPRVQGLVLLDPVSLLLHLPDVAFNFTRRVPKRANEWELWYFASMDPGIAWTLGRHFVWKDNVVWRDELRVPVGPPACHLSSTTDGQLLSTTTATAATTLNASGSGTDNTSGQGAKRRSPHPEPQPSHGRNRIRRVAVALAELDLIVDTPTVARYLCGGSIGGWYRKTRHAYRMSSTFAPTGVEDGSKRLLTRYGTADVVTRPENTPRRHSKVARDTGPVRVMSDDGIEILWYPGLDHAEGFYRRKDREAMLETIRSFCKI